MKTKLGTICMLIFTHAVAAVELGDYQQYELGNIAGTVDIMHTPNTALQVIASTNRGVKPKFSHYVSAGKVSIEFDDAIVRNQEILSLRVLIGKQEMAVREFTVLVSEPSSSLLKDEYHGVRKNENQMDEVETAETQDKPYTNSEQSNELITSSNAVEETSSQLVDEKEANITNRASTPDLAALNAEQNDIEQTRISQTTQVESNDSNAIPLIKDTSKILEQEAPQPLVIKQPNHEQLGATSPNLPSEGCAPQFEIEKGMLLSHSVTGFVRECGYDVYWNVEHKGGRVDFVMKEGLAVHLDAGLASLSNALDNWYSIKTQLINGTAVFTNKR